MNDIEKNNQVQIAGMEPTRENVNNIVNHYMYAVENGEIDGLDAHLLAKLLIDIGNGIKNSPAVIDKALDEADEYKDQLYKFGWTPKIPKPRDSWEYDDSKLDELKKATKSRQTFLQNLDTPMVDPETGEEVVPATKKPGRRTITWSELK